MDWDAALLFGALAAGAGALLYLPFFIWFRWRGVKRKQSGPAADRITVVGLCFYGAMVVVLFAGFAIGTLDPQSWLGAQVRTLFGGFGYGVLIVIVGNVLERLLVRRGVRLWVVHSSEPSPGAPPSRMADHPHGDASQETPPK